MWQPGEKPDNRQAFSKCHEYLDQNGTLLIFPEGTSYYELKLRDIKTGTARIALSFEQWKGFEGNLKIVPIALDYSDSIQFRSVVSVTVCRPISVHAFKLAYEKNEFEAVSELTEACSKRAWRSDSTDIRKGAREIPRESASILYCILCPKG